MFDTVRHRPSERNFGRPAKLILTAAAAFTLVAGGTALASEATALRTDTHRAPSAQSLLRADNLSVAEVETETDAATDVSRSDDAVEAAELAEPAEPAAQGVHGACVSTVAHDKTIVGRAHGAAVSKAAHECPSGSDDAAGKAKGAEKSAAGKAKGAEKSAAGKDHRQG